MPDDQFETKKPIAPKAMGLDADASALQKLGKALSAAVKSRAFGRSDFAKYIMEASKLAGQINWSEVKGNIEREASAEREKEEVNLRTRREKLLQAASAANWPMQQGGQLDRIDIFHLEYEGSTAVVKIGGVVLERSRESDGERLFARLRELRTALDRTPFHREDFFRMLKEAHIICRIRVGGGDESVPVLELHREMVLEHARNSERFRKAAEPKNIDPYSLPQFIFDLARFIRDGPSVGGERLATQTPSMREARETVHIPNLNHPIGNETAAARLGIKRV